ncbi:MAG: TonB-dependent receptor plug domain-containing protein [Hydrogenovibrio sp.]
MKSKLKRQTQPDAMTLACQLSQGDKKRYPPCYPSRACLPSVCMGKKRHRLCLSLLVWLMPTLTWGQAPGKEAHGGETQLEAVQITTATRTPRRLEEVPVQTTVVTREEVEKTHARNLAEALRYVPGIQLKPIRGKTGEGVWIQGFDPDRVLILVDGNPVSPSTGSTVDVTQVAIGDVERIEIMRSERTG